MINVDRNLFNWTFLNKFLKKIFPIIVFFGVSFSLFWPHLIGDYTFFGNPDRLNHSLKLLKFFSESINAGNPFQAWNDLEMMGFDAFSQPYITLNPFAFFVAAFDPKNIYIIAGFESFFLLAFSGFSAFLFFRSAVVVNNLLAILGGILYQCSAISILKVSQNDFSFMALILLPLMSTVVSRTNRFNLASNFFLFSTLTFILLEFCFIQKAAYVLIFVGLYILFIAWQRKDIKIFYLFLLAGSIGTLGATGRLVGLFEYMGNSIRFDPNTQILTYADLLKYQGLKIYDFFRWFEDGLFGINFKDQAAINNRINLSEGFLLYTSPMVPIITIVALLSHKSSWDGGIFGKLNLPRFLIWMTLFTFGVTFLYPFSYLVYLLFLKHDFFHSRILVVGLLPLVAYLLIRLQYIAGHNFKFKSAVGIIGLTFGILIVVLIENIANTYVGTWSIDKLSPIIRVHFDNPFYLNKTSAARAIISTVLGIFILFILSFKKIDMKLRQIIFITLCSILAMQSYIGAERKLNIYSEEKNLTPFNNGNIYFSSRAQFIPPSLDQKIALQKYLENNDYRSIIICDPKIAGGLCSSHIAQFWNIRLADGYYGSGVPQRLSILPLKDAIGLRQISFNSPSKLPWKILGLLNVKYAVVSDKFIYQNVPSQENQLPEIIINPEPIVPRVFFTNQITPSPIIRSKEMAEEVLDSLSPIKKSIVEGINNTFDFSGEGRFSIVKKSNDHWAINLNEINGPQFLIINELYTPRWIVLIDGVESNIYPANIFMRGIMIPAGAQKIDMIYRPFEKSYLALILLIISFIGSLFISYLIKRKKIFKI